jgi:Fe-S cluster assembly protein SufD
MVEGREKPMAKEIKIIRSSQRQASSDNRSFRFADSAVRLAQSEPEISSTRERAQKLFTEGQIPQKTEEAWRRTPLDHLDGSKFTLFENGKNEQGSIVPEELMNPLGDETQAGQILLHHNKVEKKLSAGLAEKGIIFTDLKDAELNHAEKLNKIFGKFVKPEDGYFAAMALAYAQTGIFVYIPKNVHVEQPLHSVLWTDHAEEALISHILVYLDDGASLTYVHEVSSSTVLEGDLFHDGNVEIFVGKHANLKFVELQSWGKNVLNFTHERASIDQDGQLEWVFGAVGSKLTKNFTDVDLNGRGSSAKVSGFYFTNGSQHLDLDTQQNHLAPDTTSDLLYKGALLDESRSVWQGMVYVSPDASKTDGYQTNRNLVLGKNARADAIPGLEILTDDVRCSHAATVGKIDATQTFYLESRGIPKMDAAKLVVEGFFDDIMQRIPFEGIRQRFQDAIHEKMKTFQL